MCALCFIILRKESLYRRQTGWWSWRHNYIHHCKSLNVFDALCVWYVQHLPRNKATRSELQLRAFKAPRAVPNTSMQADCGRHMVLKASTKTWSACSKVLLAVVLVLVLNDARVCPTSGDLWRSSSGCLFPLRRTLCTLGVSHHVFIRVSTRCLHNLLWRIISEEMATDLLIAPLPKSCSNEHTGPYGCCVERGGRRGTATPVMRGPRSEGGQALARQTDP